VIALTGADDDIPPQDGRAAVTLAAVSGINWGDVPTWLAVAVASVGGYAALYQLRQQGNVIKSEAERNKARDELLDRQLSELADRERAKTREQAERIDVMWDDRGVGEGLTLGMSLQRLKGLGLGLS
jgi:hypothetical protein